MTKILVEYYTPLIPALRHKVSSVAPCMKLGILRQEDCKFKGKQMSTMQAQGYMVRHCLKQQGGGRGDIKDEENKGNRRRWEEEEKEVRRSLTP